MGGKRCYLFESRDPTEWCDVWWVDGIAVADPGQAWMFVLLLVRLGPMAKQLLTQRWTNITQHHKANNSWYSRQVTPEKLWLMFYSGNRWVSYFQLIQMANCVESTLSQWFGGLLIYMTWSISCSSISVSNHHMFKNINS